MIEHKNNSGIFNMLFLKNELKILILRFWIKLQKYRKKLNSRKKKRGIKKIIIF